MRGGPPDKGGQAVGQERNSQQRKYILIPAWMMPGRWLGDWLQEHLGLTLSLERND